MVELVQFPEDKSVVLPDEVLEKAKGEMKWCLVLGERDGEVASILGGAVTEADILWALEQYKANLLSGN